MNNDGKVESVNEVKTKEPKENSKLIDGNYPIELSQGRIGKIIVKDIVTENGITTVNYTAEGIAPHTQAHSLYVKDDTGNDLIPKTYAIRKSMETPNEFTITFDALNPNKKYIIYTTDFSNYEIREDLKFNINLK